ncbi:MAG TPA: lipid II flippase MurJ [Candidatus Limnocylindria bacterium]
MSNARSALGRFLPAGGVLLSVLLFGNYVMGQLRDRIFAQTFGAGSELDAYNAAFVLPEILLDVLVASGLAAPFIPIFLQLHGEEARRANAFGQTILTGAVLVMTAVSAVLFVIAPQTTALIAPGFVDDPAQAELYTNLFRVMLVTPIIFAASLTIGDVLLAERRFFTYGIAPLLYNAGIIIGTVAFSDTLGIYGAAIGAILGALLHLVIRLIGLRGTGFRPRFRLQSTPSVGEFLRLMLPKLISHPVEPMTFLFFTAVASSIAEGSISSVSFARNYQSAAVSIVGVGFALAVFPALSVAYADADRRGFLRSLMGSLTTIVTLTTAAAIVLFGLSTFLIEFFLGGGAFDAEDVATTALILSVFTISIPLESVTHLLSRAIYATHHTLLQVFSSLAGFGVTVAATLLLVPSTGIVAIPLGFAIGQAAKVLLLGLSLAARLRVFPAPHLVGSTTTNLPSRSG